MVHQFLPGLDPHCRLGHGLGSRAWRVRAKNALAQTTIDGKEVTTKIGYSWCMITVNAETNDGERVYRFNPQKLNNWNRIRYVPRDYEDPEKGFRKFENGVEKEPIDVLVD